MPISKSAKKALRSAQAKRRSNLILKSQLKKALKQGSAKTLPQVFSVIDKAAKGNIIHKNKAARLKSRLSQQLSDSSKTLKKPAPKRTAKKKIRKRSSKKK